PARSGRGSVSMASRSRVKAATPLPTIADLGRRIAALRAEYQRQDSLHTEAAGNRAARMNASSAMSILDGQAEVLRELVTMMPALSLADAAVQINEAHSRAEILETCTHTPEQVEEIAGMVVRLLLSVLPIITAAADLDAVEMGWDHAMRSLRASRFSGLEGAA
ncbi:MAG: hypothetical protein ACRYG8_39300, partial [Janthinobacterium lividum]